MYVCVSEFDKDASTHRRAFWSEVKSEAPDINLMNVHGLRFSEAMWRAEMNYEDAIKLDPHDKTMLRTYMTFLKDVVHQEAQASQLEARLQELEALDNNADMDDEGDKKDKDK